MRNREARDGMVARVQATFKKWSSFDEMPEIDNAQAMRMSIRADVSALATLDANDRVISKTYPQQHYIEALYNVCARGTPVGRNGNQILGEPLA